MRSLLRALGRRMVAKIFAAMALVVGLALVVLAWRQGTLGVRALEMSTQQSAKQLADFIINSVEHTMLQGDGITVRELIRGFKERVPEADIRVYDPRGFEVFGLAAPPPKRESLPVDIARTLDDGKRRDLGNGRVILPIANEVRCHECHDKTTKLRGVLELELVPQLAFEQRKQVMARVLRAGFVQVMTAKKTALLPGYFKDLAAKTGSIRGAVVYDRDRDARFGKPLDGLDPGALAPLLNAGARTLSLAHDGGSLELVPLASETRCQNCHAEAVAVRGVLAFSLAGVADAPAATRELESTIDTSLRAIMLSSMGRMVANFLDEVMRSGAVRSLTLYDHLGRRYYGSARPEMPATVRSALENGDGSSVMVGGAMTQRVLVTQPLANKKRCTRCHGSDTTVRGVVTVSLPTEVAAHVRAQTIRRTAVVTGLSLAFLLGLLTLLLQVLVIRPVREIAGAAEAIGRGNLEVSVVHAHPEGDEMRRLGSSINEMVEGLRAKFHLERFVSKGAKAAAHGQRKGVGAGERIAATVLFTDIRGFTAYSETVAPEQVVGMLNRFLEAQAACVERYGGDIDKYVGDELMAVFVGERAEQRAVLCALDMLAAVERVRGPGETLQVGAGISTGEVIYGPIGAQNRMDFTVIGDVVNTGARLCSNAAGGEVLISAPVHAACGPLEGVVTFEALEPLKVKGKREPLQVLRAHSNEA